ncbi:MAG: hypothetical protein PHE48_03300 [Candidatus Daviesbacteria bacterium]|nr:hypothetical protein [Candidatus Daviesbacteria bacterium]
MQETCRNDYFPFYRVPDGKIAKGLHSDVFSLDDQWVVKRIKSVWQRKGWEERLIGDLKLLDHYLGPFIPSTTLVICSEDDKTKTLLTVQRRIYGKPLRDLSWEELLNNNQAVENLLELEQRIKQMYKETGKTPDLHGGTRNFLRQYDFKYSNNLLITTEGQVWWTDVDRLGPLWSPNWIGGKIHMALMMRSFSTFIHKLQK